MVRGIAVSQTQPAVYQVHDMYVKWQFLLVADNGVILVQQQCSGLHYSTAVHQSSDCRLSGTKSKARKLYCCTGNWYHPGVHVQQSVVFELVTVRRPHNKDR